MDSASKIDTVDIYSASMVNRGTIALAMELDFDQSSVVALVVDVAKQVAMDRFVVVELLAEEVAEVSIVLLVDIFYSTDCANGQIDGIFSNLQFENVIHFEIPFISIKWRRRSRRWCHM